VGIAPLHSTAAITVCTMNTTTNCCFTITHPTISTTNCRVVVAAASTTASRHVIPLLYCVLLLPPSPSPKKLLGGVSLR